MQYSLSNETLIVKLEGQISSANAQEVNKDIHDIIDASEFENIVLDLNDLTYISSAGLRIILALKNSYNDVSIINVIPEVYEVFDMTGFALIMDVKKKMKEISVLGKEIIGEGYFSTVYRLDKDTIIKVFNTVSDDNQIERELKLAKEAFVLGIPTAISYDIVKVDDKLGVRFELLDCILLRDAFLNNPEKYDDLIAKYVSLLKKINGTECNDKEVPLMKEFYLTKVEKIKDYIDDKYYNLSKNLINSIEDSNNFVHGDCHFKNIMMQGEELILIDMDTLSRGSYLFELASLRLSYIAFNEDDTDNAMRFFGLPYALVKKIYYDVLNKYLGKLEAEALDNTIASIGYIHLVWWYLMNEKDNITGLSNAKKHLYDSLDKLDALSSNNF